MVGILYKHSHCMRDLDRSCSVSSCVSSGADQLADDRLVDRLALLAALCGCSLWCSACARSCSNDRYMPTRSVHTSMSYRGKAPAKLVSSAGTSYACELSERDWYFTFDVTMSIGPLVSHNATSFFVRSSRVPLVYYGEYVNVFAFWRILTVCDRL